MKSTAIPSTAIPSTTMKSTLRLAFYLALTCLAPLVHAVDGPPASIDYQGTLYDNQGKPFGSEGTPSNWTSKPENKIMEFRIYDAASGGNLIWDETQTVTIDLGQFSVRLGSGAVLTPGKHDLTTSFDGKERFLELSVKEPDGTSSPILPRLAFQTSPFAFVAQRAVEADKVTSSEGSSLTGATLTRATLTGEVTATGSIFKGGTFGTLAKPATFVGDGSGLSGVALLAGGNLFDGPQDMRGQLKVGTASSGATRGLEVNNGMLIRTQNASGGSSSGWNYPAFCIRRSDGNRQSSSMLSLGFRDDPFLNIGIDSTASISIYEANADNTASALRTSDKVDMRINSPGSMTLNSKRLNVTGGGEQSVSVTGSADLSMELRSSGSSTEVYYELGSTQTGNNSWKMGTNDDTDLNFGYGVKGSMNGGEKMTILSNGNVGIGTTTPMGAKLVISGKSARTDDADYWAYAKTGSVNVTGAVKTSFASLYPNASIYAEQAIIASIFFAYSDERIKQVEGPSDTARDLAVLEGIEITDYSYIDKVGKGGRKQKKVIAQQVEKVFPQAVSKSTDVVPDIYQNATIQDGWVTLATNLKKGERVRFIGEKEEGIHEVLEVRKDSFRTDFKPGGKKVFVYGREVNDFRSVDYEAIAMLNVSATQQLKKELDAVKAENLALTARLAALEAKDQARASQLIAIEKLLRTTAVSAAQ